MRADVAAAAIASRKGTTASRDERLADTLTRAQALAPARHTLTIRQGSFQAFVRLSEREQRPVEEVTRAVGAKVVPAAVGGAGTEGILRPVVETGVNKIEDQFGVEHEELQAPTASSIFQMAMLGGVLAAHHNGGATITPEEAAHIISRGEAAELAGTPVDRVLSKRELESYTAAKAKITNQRVNREGRTSPPSGLDTRSPSPGEVSSDEAYLGPQESAATPHSSEPLPETSTAPVPSAPETSAPRGDSASSPGQRGPERSSAIPSAESPTNPTAAGQAEPVVTRANGVSTITRDGTTISVPIAQEASALEIMRRSSTDKPSSATSPRLDPTAPDSLGTPGALPLETVRPADRTATSPDQSPTADRPSNPPVPPGAQHLASDLAEPIGSEAAATTPRSSEAFVSEPSDRVTAGHDEWPSTEPTTAPPAVTAPATLKEAAPAIRAAINAKARELRAAGKPLPGSLQGWGKRVSASGGFLDGLSAPDEAKLTGELRHLNEMYALGLRLPGDPSPASPVPSAPPPEARPARVVAPSHPTEPPPDTRQPVTPAGKEAAATLARLQAMRDKGVELTGAHRHEQRRAELAHARDLMGGASGPRTCRLDVKEIRKIGRTRREKHLPVLLDKKQVIDVIGSISDSPTTPYRLIACLLYGCGLRLAEVLNLRIKDVSISDSRLVLRNTKSKRDRTLRIPCYAMPALERQIKRVREQWEQDRHTGLTTSMPGLDGVRRKYRNAPRSWGWYYVFIQQTPTTNPLAWPEERHILYRHHLNEKGVQRAVRKAAEKCNLEGVLTPHAFRHAFSTHLDERGEPLTVIQQLLGHQNIETTMIYVHRQQTSVRSPFDDAVEQFAQPAPLPPVAPPPLALPFTVA